MRAAAAQLPAKVGSRRETGAATAEAPGTNGQSVLTQSSSPESLRPAAATTPLEMRRHIDIFDDISSATVPIFDALQLCCKGSLARCIVRPSVCLSVYNG